MEQSLYQQSAEKVEQPLFQQPAEKVEQPLFQQLAEKITPIRTHGRHQLAFDMLYHIISMPLAIIYFTVVVTGLSLGLGTIVIWIGIPILFAMVLFLWQIAAFERQLAIEWLNVQIPPMGFKPTPEANWWKNFVARVANPIPWKTLAYILIKLPFSIVAFSLTISLGTTALALMLLPLGYLGDLFGTGIGLWPAHSSFYFGPGYQFLMDGQFRLFDLFLLLFTAALGVGLWFITGAILRALSFGWGQFTRVMLGSFATPYYPMPSHSYQEQHD